VDRIVPPNDCGDLIRLIRDRFEAMSKTCQRIARFLTQNPNDAAVNSVNAMADRCGIHASGESRLGSDLI